MNPVPSVKRIGDAVYRVEEEGRVHTVYVAGGRGDRWVYVDGRVFHRPFEATRGATGRRRAAETNQELAAPMPATVLKVVATAGAAVRQGDTLVILEAMKMELPIRATIDGTVRSVLCREGTLVQAGAVLVELE
jgi:biotin carboxyl carrier protein